MNSLQSLKFCQFHIILLFLLPFSWFAFFFYGAQKPAAKVAVPSKNQSAKNGTLSTLAKKGKPAASSSSSESSDDNSDEDEVSKTPFITLIIVKISRSIRGVQYSQCLVFNFFYCFQAPKTKVAPAAGKNGHASTKKTQPSESSDSDSSDSDSSSDEGKVSFFSL